jgi:methionyl-tRNA formyltransferase
VSRLRTVFMGTPEIAVPALQALAAATDIGCVITQPDRPAGRGNQLLEPPIKRAAHALGLPVWQPERLRGHEQDPRLACELMVVMAYGELLRPPVLARAAVAPVNLHASLLPRWRGASPLQAALRAGDERTGVTVMRMVPALDAGPVYLQRECALTPWTTLPELHDAIAGLAAEALGAFLASWPPPEPRTQDERAVTLCRKLESEDGHLDPRLGMRELERWVRAFTPAPGCWAWAHAGAAAPLRLRVLALAPRPRAGGIEPGRLERRDDELLLGCGDGAVAILELQRPGSRAMGARDFLNGHGVPERLA